MNLTGQEWGGEGRKKRKGQRVGKNQKASWSCKERPEFLIRILSIHLYGVNSVLLIAYVQIHALLFPHGPGSWEVQPQVPYLRSPRLLIPAKTPFTDEITLCCIITWMKFVVDISLLALTKYLRREGFILVQFKGSSLHSRGRYCSSWAHYTRSEKVV